MIPTLIKILEAFKSILTTGLDLNEKKNEKKAALVRALGEACRETEQALKKLRQGDRSDLEKLEKDISNKWINVSSLLRREDAELATTAYMKGAAWSNAENWSQTDFDKAIENIRIIDEFVAKQLLTIKN